MYSLMCRGCEFCGTKVIKNVKGKKMKTFDCKNKKIKKALALEQMAKNSPNMSKIISGEWCSEYKREGYSDDITDTLLKMQEEADKRTKRKRSRRSRGGIKL